MMIEPTTVVARLRPYYGRVLVAESMVDEASLPSGLIVPISRDEDDTIKRGVIVAIDEGAHDSDEVTRCLAVGTVVYFRDHSAHGCAAKVGDVYVVDPSAIFAYVEPD